MKDFITSYIKATEVTESCGDFLSMDLFQPEREVKNMELYRKAGFDEYMAYRGAVYKRNIGEMSGGALLLLGSISVLLLRDWGSVGERRRPFMPL